MSRKDYVAAAAIIAEVENAGIRLFLAVQFAELFSNDNSAFDSERFYAAVGV